MEISPSVVGVLVSTCFDENGFSTKIEPCFPGKVIMIEVLHAGFMVVASRDNISWKRELMFSHCTMSAT